MRFLIDLIRWWALQRYIDRRKKHDAKKGK
jgi:hypothetical protein